MPEPERITVESPSRHQAAAEAYRPSSLTLRAPIVARQLLARLGPGRANEATASKSPKVDFLARFVGYPLTPDIAWTG